MARYLDIGLSMHFVYNHLFKSEFQFKKRNDPQILMFAKGDKISRAFFEACYGMFPKVEGLQYVEQFYRDAFDAKIVTPSIDIWKLIENREAGYPLYYTIRDLDQQYESRWSDSVFVFDPLSAADVIDFWNMRLYTPDVMPINVHWLKESREFLFESIRNNYRPLPSNSNGVMIDTTIHIGRSLNAKSVVDAFDFQSAKLPQGSASIQAWHPALWLAVPEDDRILRPIAAPLSAKKQEVQLVPDDADQAIRLPLLSPDFVQFTRGGGPAWVNVVKTRFYGANSKYAEAMPSAAIESDPDYPPRAYEAQIPTREGHVTFHHFAHSGHSFRLATMAEAILGWLKSKGIEAQQSDAGRIADELIKSAGGVDRTAFLAHPEVITQLDSMARSRTTRADGNTEEFPDRTAKIGQLSAMIQKVGKRPFGRYLTLERFVEAGALQLGIAVKCNHCTKENWYSLDDVATVLKCERCLRTFSYPQGQPPRRDVWKYRVVGPFATPHFAQGAYSVALTLRFLKSEIGSLEEFTFSTGLDLACGVERLETDLFAWHNRHPFTRAARDPALIVGECKSFGTDLFKAKDVDRLTRIAELFPGAFVVAATLKPTLSQSETAALKKLCRWGWKRRSPDRPATPVIILTGSELFAPGPLYNAWLDLGGRLADVAQQFSYIHDFNTLAMATQQAHLGFSKEEMHLMVYRQSRRKLPIQAVGINVAV